MVALTNDAGNASAVLPEAPINLNAIRLWIAERPEMRLNGQRPTTDALSRYVSSYWLADETILYIGKATSLYSRVGLFFSHRLGRRSPHRGGQWLKTLSNLPELTIFAAKCESAAEAEDHESRLLGEFVQQVSPHSRFETPNSDLPLPFANIEWRTNGRKLRKQQALSKSAGGA